MSSSAVRAGRAFVEIGADTRKAFAAFGKINQAVAGIGRQMAAVGATMTAAGAAITAPISAAAVVFAKVGDSVQKMAARTGLSTEAVSGLAFAAEQSGADVAMLEKGIRTMQRTLDAATGGSAAAGKAFARLGIDFNQLAQLSPEDQLKTLADAVAGVADPGTRAALAMQVFGKAGTSLLPMLAGGAAGITELTDQAAALGLVMDRDAANSAAALTDAMNALSRSTRAITVAIGGAVAPVFTKVSEVLATLAGRFSKFASDNAGVIQTALAVGAAITGLGLALTATGIAAIGISAGLSALGGVIAAIASPIGIVAATLGGLVVFGPQIAAMFKTAFGPAGSLVGDAANSIAGPLRVAVLDAANVLQDMGDTAAQTFKGISDAITSGDLSQAMDILWAGMHVAWLKGLQAIDTAFHPWIDAVLGGFDWLGTEAAKAWEDMYATMATNTWGQYLLGATDNLVNGVMASFDWLTGQLQKSWAIISGIFDSAVNVNAEIDRIDQANRERAAERDSMRPGMAGRVGISEEEKQRIRDQAAGNKQRLDESRDARTADRAGRRDRRQQELDTAEARLRQLTSQAADAAAAVVAERKLRTPEKLDLENIGSSVDSRSQAEVAGTFSAAAVGGMGFGANIAQKQLDELKGIHAGIDGLAGLVGMVGD